MSCDKCDHRLCQCEEVVADLKFPNGGKLFAKRETAFVENPVGFGKRIGRIGDGSQEAVIPLILGHASFSPYLGKEYEVVFLDEAAPFEFKGWPPQISKSKYDFSGGVYLSHETWKKISDCLDFYGNEENYHRHTSSGERAFVALDAKVMYDRGERVRRLRSMSPEEMETPTPEPRQPKE